MSDIMKLAALLPEGVHWGDELTPQILSAAIAADRAARAEPVAWLPMETAPKDGRPVLVQYKGFAIEACWEVVDNADWESGTPDIYWWSSPLNMMDDGEEPTGWAPFYTAPPAAPVVPEEWRKLYKASVRILEAGRDTIVALGGQCDPVDQMESDDPTLREVRTMLAAAPAQSQEPNK